MAYSASSSYWLVASETSVPYRSPASIEPSVVVDASMTAMVAIIYGRVAVIEMSYCIMGIDGEVPSAGTPVNGADKVICCQK
jgi:hypothetical protein